MVDTTPTTTTNKDYPMVTGLFRDRDSAERAYQSISDRGYTKDDINLVMSDETRKKHFSGSDSTTTELGSKAAEGAGVGGAIGGAIGAIAAAVATVGSTLAIPGLGIVIAGPIAAALAGGGAGAATGGLLGALIGSGIPEERVKHYESGLKEGGILMGVKPRSSEDAAHFERSWRDDHRGEHVYSGLSSQEYGSDYDTDYRNHWQTAYGSQGGRYEEYEPAYRFGNDLRSNSSYTGRNWSEIEPAVQTDWESRNADRPWARAKDAVRHAWERNRG